MFEDFKQFSGIWTISVRDSDAYFLAIGFDMCLGFFLRGIQI